MLEANGHKVGELRKAQQDGLISDRLAPDLLLELILALTQLSANSVGETDQQDRRAAIKVAVRALLSSNP